MKLIRSINQARRDPGVPTGTGCARTLSSHRSLGGWKAFTLIEMLLALAVSAIVLAGISSVFYSAMRLRERTTALLDAAAPLDQALAVIRRDLRGALPPGQTMTGDFQSGALSSGMGRSFGLQFSTTTGLISDSAPWGDVQDVIYELRDPAVRTASGGKDLVRSVCRNLLTPGTLEWQSRLLLSNVEQLEFYCWDGTEWLPSWDTSQSETNLPAAVKVRIQLADETLSGTRDRQPFEMIVPLVCQSRVQDTNTTQTTEGEL